MGRTQVSAFKDADEVYAYIGKMFQIAVSERHSWRRPRAPAWSSC